MSEIAVITGGTSGIGRATALCLRDAGYTVYELSRREQGVEGLHHIRCDITDGDQVRSAVAEEGLLRMLLKEPELIPTVRLPGEHCSVPLFGRVLELLRERFAHGQPVTLGALEGTLSREEMEHLTMVVNRKDMTVSEQAMDDYIRTIEEEYTRTHCRGGDTLLQMARQKKETGGYGG